MAHDPLSPAEALRTRTGAVLAAVSLLVLLYSILVVAQILLGVMIAGTLSAGMYLTYRTFAALDAAADAAQRIAAARERGLGERDDHDRPTERERTRSEELGRTRSEELGRTRSEELGRTRSEELERTRSEERGD